MLRRRAHVFVMRDGKMLILQQATGLGWWEQPGGELEDGETPLDAASRETLEETGLRIERAELMREWKYRNDGGEEHECFACVAEAPHGEVRLSDEHSAYAWMSISEYAERYCGPRVIEAAPAYVEFLTGMRDNCQLLQAWQSARRKR